MSTASVTVSATAPAVPVSASGTRRLPWIVVLLFLGSFLNYLDRQTLSILKPTIKTALALDDSGYAFLVNVFTFCYAAAYIGSGWVVDRIGARKALTIFVTGWSLATIGCGLVSSFFAFAAFRALLGIMEPGNYPCTMRAMTLWAPPGRRAVLMGLAGAGGTIGAVVAAPMIASLATWFSWQMAFIVPGLLGIGFAVAWWFVYREPQELTGVAVAHPASSPLATAAEPPALAWSKLWTQRSLWGIVLARFISDPVWYFCLFWMPGYFQEQRGLSLQASGMVGWIPFLVGNLGALGVGFLSDRLGRRLGDPMKARQRLLMIAACFGPLAMLVPHAPGMTLTLILLSLVALVCLVWLLLLGPLVADTFPAGNAASVWAISGAFGAIGAILFNYGVGRISGALGVERMFLVMGVLHLVAAALLKVCVRPVKAGEP
ncbi:MFS transporter [Opitutaceae bacterium TAV5]|nr:MFS transporter [Opitutaceae bacterium TAV5]